MRQLVLDLPHAPGLGADDFLVSPSNAEAFNLVESWPIWPDRLVLVTGPAGSGKSHLAAIWAERAEAAILPARDVSAPGVPVLAAGEALVLEDLDQGPLDEAALFHLVNLSRERGLGLLLTSRHPVAELGIGTQDLASRLRLAPAVALQPPDDALLKAVLVKLFLDRQLVVDTTVIDYVAHRIERSLSRAAEVVIELDRETLAQGRRVTRPAAAEVLRRHLSLADEDG